MKTITMRVLVRFLCVAILSVLSHQVMAWAAIAVDGYHGVRGGWSYDYPDAYGAQQRALNECGSGCMLLGWIETGCIAFSVDRDPSSSVIGMATSYNRDQAQNMALQICRSNGGSDCIVRVWACN